MNRGIENMEILIGEVSKRVYMKEFKNSQDQFAEATENIVASYNDLSKRVVELEKRIQGR